jgi:cytosine permease
MPKESKISIDDLFEDYATTPVPDHKTVGGFGIGMINGGLAFAVPGLITGLEIGNALGLKNAIYAFILGGLILSVLGVATGLVGMHNRLASCMTMKFVFGKYGANFISIIFIFSLLGWYGVNIDLFSSVTRQLSHQLFNYSPSIFWLEIIIGVVITLTTIWGFKLIERISNWFVPLLFLVVVYMLFQSIGYEQVPKQEVITVYELGFGEAVSVVVGSFIVSVVLMPDFTRFAKTKSDTVVASFLPFFVLSTFVYIVSAIAGLAVKDDDILVVMLTLGLGGFAFFLLIVSSWVTNVVNLYSAALGLNSINPKFAEWKVIVLMGGVGTIVASFNLLESFTEFLFGLSIIFTPVAAIYVIDFFLIRKNKPYQIENLVDEKKFNVQALLAWFLGIIISMLSNQGYIKITSIEVCDALIGTSIFYCLIKYFTRYSKKEDMISNNM